MGNIMVDRPRPNDSIPTNEIKTVARPEHSSEFNNPGDRIQSEIISLSAQRPSESSHIYFPLGHHDEGALNQYHGKYSQQPDFLLFKDRSSCERQEFKMDPSMHI